MADLEHRMTLGGRLSATIRSRGTFFAGCERVPPSRCIVGLPALPPDGKPAVVAFREQADAMFAASEPR